MHGIVDRELGPDPMADMYRAEDPMKKFLAMHSKFKLIQYVRKGVYYAQVSDGEGNTVATHSRFSAEMAIQELLKKISKAEWYQ